MNLTRVILTLLTLITLSQAKAKTTEVCISPSGDTKVEILMRENSYEPVQIELYQDGHLVARDAGPFFGGPCHVDGYSFGGQILSYGGCYPFGEKAAKFLTYKKSGGSLDLNTFNCILQ